MALMFDVPMMNVEGIACDFDSDCSFDHLLNELVSKFAHCLKISSSSPAKNDARAMDLDEGFDWRYQQRIVEALQRDHEQNGSLARTTESAQSTGDLIRSAETALKMEERRLQIYEQVSAINHAMNIGSKMEDYSEHERKIRRNIRNIRGSEDSVRTRASELLNLIHQPSLPQSISIMMFVDMIVAQCNKPIDNRSLYAYGRIIVLVASRVPLAVDMLIAKLNRVCIYTVPKHISYPSKSPVFETNEAYYKAIGFGQEEDDSFLGRMTACMKLYGALVQTEIQGIQNLHGLEEGWAWLARFLNALPPNLYTTVALYSFLEMAGYAMYKRFRQQFMKIVHIIEQDFLEALQEDLKSTTAVHNFRNYLKSKQFLKEPEERELKERGHVPLC